MAAADGPAMAGRPAAVSIAASGIVRPAALAIVTMAALILRRPDQFISPYVWIEDGWFLLRMFLEHGWSDIFEPLAGYQILANKLIAFTAFSLSIRWTPEIMLALVSALTCAVVAAVAFSPTHLRWPFLCALAVLAVPTGPEVFSISAYAVWWAGLLLLLTPIWDSSRGREWLRWSYLVFGGLSSPIVVPVAAALLLRAARDRTRADGIAAALAIGLSGIQILSMYLHPGALEQSSDYLMTFAWSLQKFVGAYFHAAAPVWAGFLACGVIAVLLWLRRARLDLYFWLLALCLVAIAAMTTLRLSYEQLSSIDKYGDGTRYFFYPFVLFSWLLIWLAHESGRPVRLTIAAAIAMSIIIGLPRMQRRNDHLDWREQLALCAASREFELPIHYQGSISDVWRPKFTGAECRAMIERSIFH